jgi:hypothetical protein
MFKNKDFIYVEGIGKLTFPDSENPALDLKLPPYTIH